MHGVFCRGGGDDCVWCITGGTATLPKQTKQTDLGPGERQRGDVENDLPHDPSGCETYEAEDLVWILSRSSPAPPVMARRDVLGEGARSHWLDP